MHLVLDISDDDLFFLLANDSNELNRWSASMSIEKEKAITVEARQRRDKGRNKPSASEREQNRGISTCKTKAWTRSVECKPFLTSVKEE